MSLNCSRTSAIGGSGRSRRFIRGTFLRLGGLSSSDSFSGTGFVKLGPGDHTLAVDRCRLRFCMLRICRSEFSAASNLGLRLPPSPSVVLRTASATVMGQACQFDYFIVHSRYLGVIEGLVYFHFSTSNLSVKRIDSHQVR